jgi:hypothetical protein
MAACIALVVFIARNLSFATGIEDCGCAAKT